MMSGRQEKTRIVYFIERLGDRIILKYVTEYFRDCYPWIKFVAFQNFKTCYSIRHFDITEWAPGLYMESFATGTVVNGRELTEANAADVLDCVRLFPMPGNLFVFAPQKIAETGKYPTLTVPPRIEKWRNSNLYRKLGDRYENRNIIRVCFHCLTDAPYSKTRNHCFPEWKRCMQILAKRDNVIVYRVGSLNTMHEDLNNGKNLFDFTVEDLTVPQSIGIVSDCDIYIGGDTGMTHAASALDKKIVGIWGDITHMVRDKGRPNNIQPGDWDSGPYVPESRRFMLRRTGGPNDMTPIFPAEKILEGIDLLLEQKNDHS